MSRPVAWHGAGKRATALPAFGLPRKEGRRKRLAALELPPEVPRWPKSFGNTSSVDGLVSLADTGAEPEIRGMATIALGYIGSPDRVSALTRCFANTSYRKRFAGWDTLYRIAGIL